MVKEWPKIVNVQPSGRWSALHQAAESGNAEAVKFLLAHGANLEVLTSDGKTPKDVADSKVVALLEGPPTKKARVAAESEDEDEDEEKDEDEEDDEADLS